MKECPLPRFRSTCWSLVAWWPSTNLLLLSSSGNGLTRASMPLSITQTGHKNHLLSTAEKGKREDNILLQGGWCRHSSLYVRHLLCCSHWRSSCHSTWSQCYGVPSNTAFNNFLASSILILIFVAICNDCLTIRWKLCLLWLGGWSPSWRWQRGTASTSLLWEGWSSLTVSYHY